jgi:hypothetical protein
MRRRLMAVTVQRTTPVIFACHACGASYEAMQQNIPSKGIFRCKACYWPVHEWDGEYRFVDWRQLKSGNNPSR